MKRGFFQRKLSLLRYLLGIFLLFFLSVPGVSGKENPGSPSLKGQDPLSLIPFMENSGNYNPEIFATIPTQAGTTFVTQDGRLMHAFRISKRLAVVEERFVGAKKKRSRPMLVEKAPTRVSYIRGNDPKRWIIGQPTFRRLDLGEVWPGIRVDLVAR